jgi:hypothetical protein
MNISKLAGSLLFIGITSVFAADVAPKTIAIKFDKGKSTDDLLQNMLERLQGVASEEGIKSVELLPRYFGHEIEVQTITDDKMLSQSAVHGAVYRISEDMKKANLPYSTRFQQLPKNIFFGDKSIQVVSIPYEKCYDQKYLSKKLENIGMKIVNVSENPDITLTIGIDVCMTENELKNLVSKKSEEAIASTPSKKQGIGTDLVRAGSSVQLGSPSGYGNAGVAVAGIGLALNVVDWLSAPPSPQEHDMVRYHIKIEGTDKPTAEFYPLVRTDKTHKSGDAIAYGASHDVENVLIEQLNDWNNNPKKAIENLYNIYLEKDLIKQVPMVI